MGIDLVGKAKRVRIYVTEDERVGRAPASLAILEFLRRENAQGATVIRASSGFGSTGQIHTPHLVDVAQHLPVIIEWIDRPEVVERLLPRVKEQLPHGLITVDDTEIVHCDPHPVRDVPSAMTARDVMSRDVKTVTKTTPVRELVEAMMGQQYRAVPVVEDGLPVGIVTNGDLVSKGGLGVRVDLLRSLDKPAVHSVLERLSQASKSKVAADVMTPSPVTVPASAPLPEVAALMTRRRLKRLPVVDGGGRLVGIVSRVDVLKTAAGSLAGMPAAPREIGLAGDTPLSKVMRRDIPLVHPETPLPEVFQAVVATRLNRALVVDRTQRVVGIVTDAELLERVTPALRESALRSLMRRLPFTHDQDEAMHRHARARTAADLMSSDVVTAREDTLLSEAIALMLNGTHKVLAVTDAGGRLVGLVDRADLLHGLAPA
jgi:CBS domain-containing protein